MKITCEEDCSNAPKKLLLKDLNVAFAKGEVNHLAQNITDDINWTVVGDMSVQGKDQFIKSIQEMGSDGHVTELNIKNIITHGNAGAVDGLIVMNGKTYAFCDVYKFSGLKNPKIKELTSYVIGLGKE